MNCGGGGVTALTSVIIALTVLSVIIMLALLTNGIKLIGLEERGMYMRMGRFVRVLPPGMNFVTPLISTVVKVNISEQVIEIPRQLLTSKDKRSVEANGVIHMKVIDPAKAFFNVTNYRTAIVYLAQNTIARLVGEMTLDEAMASRNVVDEKLRKALAEAGERWGVKVEAAGVNEFFPAHPGGLSKSPFEAGIPQGRIEHGEFKIGKYGAR